MGRAIVRQPKAFLFDEPLSNLDALLRSEMRVEIKKLHQQLGNTIVYVTHDQVEAMTLADRIVVLQAGNLIQYDTPDGIYNRPAAQFVAGFTGSPPMNFLPARVGEGGRTLHLAGRRRPAGARVARRRMRAARRTRGDVRAATRAHHDRTRRRAGRVQRRRPRDARRAARLGHARARSSSATRRGRRRDDRALRAAMPALRVGQTLPVSLALDHFHLFDPKTGVAIRGADW